MTQSSAAEQSQTRWGSPDAYEGEVLPGEPVTGEPVPPSKAPNPWGSPGKPDHVGTVRELADEAAAEFRVRSANPIVTEVEGGGRVFYGTPQGQLIEAPSGYYATAAQNGKGLVLLPEGQSLGNNANIIRWGEPNALHPQGYFRYYNEFGQALDPMTGQPASNLLTHIDPSYQGPLIGYPGR
jgi:hypothetical protein